MKYPRLIIIGEIIIIIELKINKICCSNILSITLTKTIEVKNPMIVTNKAELMHKTRELMKDFKELHTIYLNRREGRTGGRSFTPEEYFDYHSEYYY